MLLQKYSSCSTYRSPFFFAGFTLAELLIALAILGIIATFTIPKVLQTNQDNKYKATAKEAAALIGQAYQVYLQDNGYSTEMVGTDLTPYINYVRGHSGLIDDTQTDASNTCNSVPYECFQLHNGGVLILHNAYSFDGTTSLNAIPIKFDPDGVYGGTTDGPGKAVGFFLYYNGRISDRGSIPAGTLNSGTSYGPAPAKNPPWFSWN